MMNKSVTRYAAVFAALHALIALVTNSHRVFFGLYGPVAVWGHHEIFFRYASRALRGQVPYREYLIEYPPLGFVVFLLPRLLTSDFPRYMLAFAAQLLLFNAATVYLVARRVERQEGTNAVPGRLGWYTLFFTALCPMIVGPYDLAPMFLGFAAAVWWFAGRPALGGLAAGLGTLMKIFPGLVAGPGVLWELAHWKPSRGRGTLTCLLTLGIGVAAWLGLGGRGVLNTIRYHSERGLQAESLYAGLVFLYGKLTGQTVTTSFDHVALHITPDWGGPLARLALPLQAAALGLVLWRYVRAGMTDGVRYSGAMVLAFIVTGKVLSPQYMTWMIPFVAVLGGPRAREGCLLFFIACLLSSVSYPWGGLALLQHHDTAATVLLNVRNLALLWLLWIMVGANHGQTAARPRVTASMGEERSRV
jgi:hypothetical protein